MPHIFAIGDIVGQPMLAHNLAIRAASHCDHALALIHARAPDLSVEGEMHGDAALSKRVLDRVFPDSALTAEANLLMMPNLDAGNIAYNLLRVAAGSGITVGPILLGTAKSAHILTQTATVRGILNMTALAAHLVLGLRKIASTADFCRGGLILHNS